MKHVVPPTVEKFRDCPWPGQRWRRHDGTVVVIRSIGKDPRSFEDVVACAPADEPGVAETMTLGQFFGLLDASGERFRFERLPA